LELGYSASQQANRLMSSFKRDILFFKVLTLSGLLVFSLIVLEIVLRLVSPPSPFSPLLPLRPHNKMELQVNLRGVSLRATHTTNKWGFRGPEPPADWENHYTIVTIGGSTTQCFYLDDHRTWSYLLGEKLKDKYPNVWVGNGGLDGQSTHAHIIFMRKVISQLKPKGVIVLAGANDLGFSISDGRETYGNPWDKPDLSWKHRIFASSRLVQILYIWKKIIFDDVTVVRGAGHGNFEPQPLIGEEQTSNQTPLPEDLKTLLPSLGEYQENIRKIIQLGRSMGVKVIFLTQPMLFDNTEYWRGIEGRFFWIKNTNSRMSAATYWKLQDIYNKGLIETCQIENISCFDLASAIPHSDLYFYDAYHFTEQGAELVAATVADYLKNLQ
jgi:lysophospholipase L1-like esterase